MEEIFKKMHYDDLTESEKSEIAEFCPDQNAFQHIQNMLNHAGQALPVAPPISLKESLNKTFDEHYTPVVIPLQKRFPVKLAVFLSVAAVLVFVYLAVNLNFTDQDPALNLAQNNPKKAQEKKQSSSKESQNNPAISEQQKMQSLTPSEPLITIPAEIEDVPFPMENASMNGYVNEKIEVLPESSAEIAMDGDDEKDALEESVLERKEQSKRLSEVRDINEIAVSANKASLDVKGSRDRSKVNQRQLLKQIKPLF
jgi:hypothetical protein